MTAGEKPRRREAFDACEAGRVQGEPCGCAKTITVTAYDMGACSGVGGRRDPETTKLPARCSPAGSFGKPQREIEGTTHEFPKLADRRAHSSRSCPKHSGRGPPGTPLPVRTRA